MSLAFDLLLVFLMLAIAIWILVVGETFSAAIGFVAYGLLLALAWVRLAAVDVALTEAAVGGGLTGALLIAAASRLHGIDAPAAGERSGIGLRLAAGGLCAIVAAGLAAVVLWLPDPAPSLAPQAAANLAATGLDHAVSAVLVAYRAIDTLQEKVVLLLAVLGVWSLAPDGFWGGRPGRMPPRDADGALALLGQLLPPVGIVLGVYSVWASSSAPGGAFQGGTLMAAMWLLARGAGLTDAPPIDRRWLRLILAGGPAMFLFIGLAGIPLAGHFLAYPIGFAKPLILVIEAALTLSIAAALALLVTGPPERAPDT